MKQSNWILGLGIIIAVLLIATTLYFKSDPLEQSNAGISVSNTTPTEIVVRNVSLKPIREATERTLRILLK